MNRDLNSQAVDQASDRIKTVGKTILIMSVAFTDKWIGRSLHLFR